MDEPTHEVTDDAVSDSVSNDFLRPYPPLAVAAAASLSHRLSMEMYMAHAGLDEARELADKLDHELRRALLDFEPRYHLHRKVDEALGDALERAARELSSGMGGGRLPSRIEFTDQVADQVVNAWPWYRWAVEELDIGQAPAFARDLVEAVHQAFKTADFKHMDEFSARHLFRAAVSARAIDRLLMAASPASDDQSMARSNLALFPQEAIPIAVHVASYVGTAALSGFIGARADAIIAALVKLLRRWLHGHGQSRASQLFRRTHRRWQRRATGGDTPLAEGEAADAAIAAALTQGYDLSSLAVAAALQESDGSWLVSLTADGENLRAHVPPGDPAHAKILIIASR